MALDPQDLREALAGLVVSEKERQSATRTLQTLSQPVSHENIRLVVAAKQVLDKKRGGKICRLTPALFLACKKEVVSETKCSRLLYMVPKKSLPDVECDAQLKDWLEYPENVDFNPEEWWLFDSGCPRGKLGKGVLTIEVSVAQRSSFLMGKEEGSVATLQKLARETAEASGAPASSTAQPASTKVAQDGAQPMKQDGAQPMKQDGAQPMKIDRLGGWTL